MYKETIGLVGGFGAYATLDFFARLLECFPAEKENERPRIIMDNNFPMPSRVRAILYDEHYSQIVEEICGSIQYLMDGNADKIVLVCSTAHAFLPEVLEKLPHAEERIVSLTKCVSDNMKKENITNAVIIGSEGTLDTGVYDKALAQAGIAVYKPVTKEYPEIREFIESVKQKNITDMTLKSYIEFCNRMMDRYNTNNMILGCTELPVLVKEIAKKQELLEECREKYSLIQFWDPLDCVLEFLRDTLK